jgi:hypothetical protein
MEELGFNNLYQQEYEYRGMFTQTLIIIYGTGILFTCCFIVKYCRRRDSGHNRLRREYIV